MAGKLWLVPTPIGNLEDITLRALRVLKEVELILAEDTRTSSVLLKHYDISTPTRPYHLNNEHAVVSTIVTQLQTGREYALISDAGSPGISDPGFLLVRECWKSGVAVEALPGATALIPALTSSGFPCERFLFEGFLPPKKGRQKRLQALLQEAQTVVLYESPHRLVRLLEELVEWDVTKREILIAHELTKVFASLERRTPAEHLAVYQAQESRGEYVIVIPPYIPPACTE